MGRPLPSLLIGAARLPVDLQARRAFGKHDLARCLAPVDARNTARQDILLVHQLRVREPDKATRLDAPVADLLADCRRRATRPQRGLVPAGAEAVIFADTAELLACLLMLGPAQPWWCKAAVRLLGPIATPAQLGQSLAERATHLPATVHRLLAYRGTPETLGRIAQLDVPMLACALAQTWNVILANRAEETTAHVSPERTTAQPAPPAAPEAIPTSPSGALVQAAWLLGTPQHRAATNSADPVSNLLSYAAGIADAPSMTFAVSTPRSGTVTPPALNPVGQAEPQTRPQKAPITTPSHKAAPLTTDVRPIADQPSPLQSSPEPRAQHPTAADTEEQAAPPAAPTPTALDGTDPAATDAATEKATTLAANVYTTWNTPAPDPIPMPRQMQTNLGGVFFLWHLCHAFDLPAAAFDWHMPQAVGAWGLIDAMARGLLHPAMDETDPVWALLCELEGRDPDAPLGAAMWLPTGLTDQPQPPHIPGVAPVLAQWLTLTLPRLRERLADALECAADQVHAILHRPARIDVAAAEINVVFHMAQADTTVRSAGLDVDPGWVPALRHIVRFHYV